MRGYVKILFDYLPGKCAALVVFAVALLGGCAQMGQGGGNKYSGLAQTLGLEKTAQCYAMAQYFATKGKDHNYNFGSEYKKPYFTEKWHAAKMQWQFFYNIGKNFPEGTFSKQVDAAYDPASFTREKSEQCYGYLVAASDDIKRDILNAVPYITDPQVIPFYCSSSTRVSGRVIQGGVQTAIDAITYHSRGMNPGGFICRNDKIPLNARKIEVIETDRGAFKYIGKFEGASGTLYAPLQYPKSVNLINYFPDSAK